jgi:nicotinate phosphoribosyltransferase
MSFYTDSPFPEGVVSLLDTDLYKLTMQCAVLRWFREVPVTYAFTNRTPEKRLSRKAFDWLQTQVGKLGYLRLSKEEYDYLKRHCPYLGTEYLEYLREFSLNPRKQVALTFTPVETPGNANGGADAEVGDVAIKISGTWADTILYEIPILALTSEAYFRFCDTDWDYDGQEEKAHEKARRLLEGGCVFSEFGTRRRRDYHTQALVCRGIVRATREAKEAGTAAGKFSGTSNVHLAMRFDMAPVGTVAHEWFMGIAALTDNYTEATETALRHWIATFGTNLSVALTDTFGTRDFTRSFSLPVGVVDGGAVTAADAAYKTYAQFFAGVRQDSGDPETYIGWMQRFYADAGIKDRKTIVFSDALDVDKCLRYRALAEEAGFAPTFGIGTYMTNDFVHRADGSPSKPMNIVVKLSSANGRPAVKISDNVGKNTGDKATVERVKEELGYVEREWKGGDEATRWGGDMPVQAQAVKA